VFVPYDAESLNFEMRVHYGPNPIRRAYFIVEALKWRSVEATYFPLAQACVAVSPEDAEAITRRWKDQDRSRMHVIPNGVQVTFFSPLQIEAVPNTIVMTGNMRALDTVTSIQWFLLHVLPLIRRAIPSATVEIVGRDPLPSLGALARQVQGVRLRGYVPDIRPHLARASIYAAPLRLGSGVKNRILEAMAMGKAVITTPLGARGLVAQPGRDLLTVLSEQRFADATIELLSDPSRRIAIGKAAREVVVAHHSWDAVGERVDSLLTSLQPQAGLDGVNLWSSSQWANKADEPQSLQRGG
jgi:glycosyltransferase involved in cell wall biosynthesis